MELTSTDAESRLKDTRFLIEATDNEWHTLWVHWCSKSLECREPLFEVWEQLGGWLVTVGTLDDRPVCISLNFDRLDGFLVCIWNATSEVVDYKAINDWFDKHYHAVRMGGGRARCNAANFHICTFEIADRKKVGELNAT